MQEYFYVQNSLDGSIRNCEKKLKELHKHLKTMIKDTWSIINANPCSKDFSELLEESEIYLNLPETVISKYPVLPDKPEISDDRSVRSHDIVSNIRVQSSLNSRISNRRFSNVDEGLAVAAKFTDDNRWYRAQIIGQQTRNMFEVRYVDFGNTELLHIRRICGLPQEFFRITVQSISSSSSSEIDDEERIKESKSVDENTDLTRPSEMRFQVNIINCISPNMIYFSLTDQYIANMRLMNSMMNFYRDEKNNKDCIIDLVSEKMKCAVYIEKDKKWYRGVVLKVIDCKMTKIFLSDTAEEVIISLENLRTLPEQFVKEVDCALRCSLANVEYKEKWPLEICEMLKKKLKNYEEMYIVRKDCKENALIVELWGKNVVCKGPLEPAIVEWTNINKLLMENENLEDEQNEAKDYKPPIVENLKLFELESALKNSKDHVTEWLQSNIVEARSKGIEYELLIEKSHFSHEKNKLKELESGGMSVVEKEQVDTNIESVSIIEENEDWLPPIPLKETNFIGMPTYVNSDFNVYVQISGSIYDEAAVMEETRGRPYCRLSRREQNLILTTIRHEEGFVDITKNLVLVEYVDFGNTEWVKPKYLRKNISFKDIPLQCYKFPILSDCVSFQINKTNSIDSCITIQVTENNESTISDFYLQNNMGILTVQVTEILSLNEIVINIIDCDADASVYLPKYFLYRLFLVNTFSSNSKIKLPECKSVKHNDEDSSIFLKFHLRVTAKCKP
ncbi:hypothetical protein PGB90_002729 [Kerria lacca]